MKRGALSLVLLLACMLSFHVFTYTLSLQSLCHNYNNNYSEQSDFKSLVENLDVHAVFFKQLLCVNQGSLSDWFVDSGLQVCKQLQSEIEKIKNTKSHSLNRVALSSLIEISEWLDQQKPTQKRLIADVWENHGCVREKIQKLNCFFQVDSLLSLFDVCGWLFDSGKKILINQITIQREFFARLEKFPFQQVSQRLGSIALRTALLALQQTGSFGSLIECWEALRLLSGGQADAFDSFLMLDKIDGKISLAEKITLATFFMKEFSQLIYILYIFFIEHYIESSPELYNNRGLIDYFQSFLPTQQGSVIEIISIYDEVNKLPIDYTLKAIGRLINDFTRLIDRIQKNSGMQLYPWLQSKWVTIPLTAGIVMIKVIQYFLPLNNASPSYFSSHSSYGGYNNKPGGSSGSIDSANKHFHIILPNNKERKIRENTSKGSPNKG